MASPFKRSERFKPEATPKLVLSNAERNPEFEGKN
jgi:hypothetical protein